MTADIDLKATLAKRRIVGLYRLMVGYRWLYLGALVSVAAGALMRTYYYRLVQHIVDNVLGRQGAATARPCRRWIRGPCCTRGAVRLSPGHLVCQDGRRASRAGCATIFSTTSSAFPLPSTTTSRQESSSSAQRQTSTRCGGSSPTRRSG